VEMVGFGFWTATVTTYQGSLQQHDRVPAFSLELSQAGSDLARVVDRVTNGSAEPFEERFQAFASFGFHRPPFKSFILHQPDGDRRAGLPPRRGVASSREPMAQPLDERGLRLDEWCRRAPLAGDASARRYSRLWKEDGASFVMVEYPAAIRHELDRDLRVNAWCRQQGLRVAAVVGCEVADGRALLEDLGDIDGEAALIAALPGQRRAILTGMLMPLQVLASCAPEDLPPWNPPLDRWRLRWELAGFELWFVRHLRATRPWPALGRWLDDLADEIAGHPQRVCHRDYHLNNLLVQTDGSVAVIDIQDMLVGPDTYDVVSLLAERGAVNLVAEDDRDAVLETWASLTGAAPGWKRRAQSVRLQRGLKVLGTFARFAVAGRDGYTDWLSELALWLAEQVHPAAADPRLTSLLLD
jgi:aminoglycoside/choline kinase family phosphotransferase